MLARLLGGGFTARVLVGVMWLLATLVVLLFVHRLWRGQRGVAAIENTAGLIVEAGLVFGVFAVAVNVGHGCVLGASWLGDAFWVLVFGVTAVVLLEVVARAGVHWMTRGLLEGEIGRGNPAAAVVAGGHCVATGMLAAAVFHGTSWTDLWVSCLFFAIAQATLHVLLWLFRRVTAYADAEEVAGGNLAAALSHAGINIAIALVVANACDGPFVGWNASLQAYAQALLLGLAFYPVRQILVEGVILGRRPVFWNGELDRAIRDRRDAGAGVLEAATYLATALLVGNVA